MGTDGKRTQRTRNENNVGGIDMTDNKSLVRTVVLPDMEEIDNATVSEITEVKQILVKYEALLGKIIRARL